MGGSHWLPSFQKARCKKQDSSCLLLGNSPDICGRKTESFAESNFRNGGNPVDEKNRLSALVEGALLAALTAMLALLGILIPPLSMVTSLVWTLPIVVVIVRRDFKTGLMATAVAGFLVFLFTGPVRAFLLFTQFGGLGLVYGYIFKRKISAGWAVFGGGLVSVISAFLTIFFSTLLLGVDYSQWGVEISASIKPTLEMYERLGLLEKMADQGITKEMLRQNLQQMARVLGILLPGIITVAAVFSAFINYLLARILLKKLRISIPPLPPFRQWRLPWYTVWGIIAGLALVLAGDYWKIKVLVIIGQNILYVYVPLLMVTGTAVVVYFYHHWRIAPLFKVLIVFLVFMYLPIAFSMVLMLGLFDPLFNYRRLSNQAKGE